MVHALKRVASAEDKQLKLREAVWENAFGFASRFREVFAQATNLERVFDQYILRDGSYTLAAAESGGNKSPGDSSVGDVRPGDAEGNLDTADNSSQSQLLQKASMLANLEALGARAGSADGKDDPIAALSIVKTVPEVESICRIASPPCAVNAHSLLSPGNRWITLVENEQRLVSAKSFVDVPKTVNHQLKQVALGVCGTVRDT